jgi:hypothetical protein
MIKEIYKIIKNKAHYKNIVGIVMLKEINTISKPICKYCKGHKKSQQLLGNLYACIRI